MSHLSFIDQLIVNVDNVLKTVLPFDNRPSQRATPGEKTKEQLLSLKEKKHVAGLMRVNHAGEVCAQALYQGQALTAKLEKTRREMEQAAQEEVDHLAWCEVRLKELHSKPSLLNPFWYSASFLIGALAGVIGDKWSLGFVVETERQLTAHLEKHIEKLPIEDKRSLAILEQMRSDEMQHAIMAKNAGGAELPLPIKIAMHLTSKIMTTLAYRV